jgi:hypothetical protein
MRWATPPLPLMACTWTTLRVPLDENEPLARSAGAADSLATFRIGYNVKYALPPIYLLDAAPKQTEIFHELKTHIF